MHRFFDCAGSEADSPMSPPSAWPSASLNSVGTPEDLISQLDGWPTCAPVNASPAADPDAPAAVRPALRPSRRRDALHRLVSLDLSSARGRLRLLLYIPDRSKQQGRRFPAASIEQAFLIRRARVSACLAETIQ